jgi:hypothetical protein
VIRMTLSAAATVLEARFAGDDREFTGVSTDTRSLAPGQLFFALRGPNFDAHEKLQEALAAGAVAAVVERAMPCRVPQLVVADTRAALGTLARAWRQRFAIPVLAVTGSAGKTTVKEMLAAIMRTQGPVLATSGNFNNDIGLPLTLFQLDASHRAAVLEMGANHVGDIALLVAIARPRIGVITLCAPGHLEGFGSIEGVARTKGEMFAGLPDDGIAILNDDDAQALLWRELAGRRRVVSFGAAADFRADDVEASTAGTDFTLRTPQGSIGITLKHRGLHNVRNALAAAAAASAAGVSLADIRRGPRRGRHRQGTFAISCRPWRQSPHRRPDRSDHSRGRPAVAPVQGRHADHGRRADPAVDRGQTLLWADLRNRFVWVVLASPWPSARSAGTTTTSSSCAQPTGLARAGSTRWQSLFGSAAAALFFPQCRRPGRDHALSCRCSRAWRSPLGAASSCWPISDRRHPTRSTSPTASTAWRSCRR